MSAVPTCTYGSCRKPCKLLPKDRGYGRRCEEHAAMAARYEKFRKSNAQDAPRPPGLPPARKILNAWETPKLPPRRDGKPDWWSVLENDARLVPINLERECNVRGVRRVRFG